MTPPAPQSTGSTRTRPVPPRATRPAGPAGPVGALLIDALASLGLCLPGRRRVVVWGSMPAALGRELERCFDVVEPAHRPADAAEPDADLALALWPVGAGPASPIADLADRLRPGGVAAVVVAEPVPPVSPAPALGADVEAEWLESAPGPRPALVARMTVRNRSRQPWGMPPGPPALIGARWFDRTGAPVAVDEALVALPAAFPAGGQVSGTIALSPPPGAAWAEVDVAHPGRGWGSATGGPGARLPLPAVPAPVPPGRAAAGGPPEGLGDLSGTAAALAGAGLAVAEPLELSAGPGRGLWIGPPAPSAHTWLVGARRLPAGAGGPAPAVGAGGRVAPGDPWPYRCSIVIPTYNRVEVAEECLVSVGDHSADGTYEVVVVDNASSDGMPSLLDLLDGDVQVIRNPVNRGFAVASNQGAATARGEYLVFLNADIIAGPGWLDPLLRRLDGDSSIGAVGARLLYPDGRLQHGGVWLLETPYPGEPLRAVHRWYQGPGDRVEALQAGPVTAVTAAVMAVRRAAWEQVGGFDEGYWNGYEDVDLCLRLRAAGWTVCYEPASTLVHAESVSGPERFSAAAANIVRLQRWQPLVRPDGRIDRDGRVQLHRAASPRRNTR